MASKSEEAKKRGNDCMKEQKFIEAMLHYTDAIKTDTKNHLLYSNRSLAFLKTQSFYHAMQDALTVIKLKPDWPKGYYRKGEVEYAAEHYKEALQSYKVGLSIEPDDTGLQDALTKATKALREQKTKESRIPLYGLAVGVGFGLMVVIGDTLLTKKPVLVHWILQLIVILAITGIGYGLAYAYRSFLQSSRSSLLEEPIDLFPEEGGDAKKNGSPAASSSEPDESPSPSNRPRTRSSTSSARQRYKKGKS